MHIIIIGAGMGGLAAALSLAQAGHQVTILESAAALAEIGAGVQMTPNATKYLWKWGLGPDILASASLPGGFYVRDGSSGETLGKVPFDDFEKLYGAPYLVIHRADIHRILHEHAVRAGVEVKLNSRVIKYGFADAEVFLETGASMKADLIVGADGVNSSARKALCAPELSEHANGKVDADGLEKTGWAAYRIVAQMEKLHAHPEIASLVAEHNCNCWVGSNCLLMMYLVKGSKVLNIVVSHRDDIDTTGWTQDQFRTEIQTLTADFHPSLKQLLDLAEPLVQNWPISQVADLPRWTHNSARFLLMGDAAHAMAFYLSMGVSMAIEDAAALTECLSLAGTEATGKKSEVDLSKAMGVFERVRKFRSEAVRDASLHGGNMLQLPAGPEREKRNVALLNDGLGEEEYGERFFAKTISYGIADRKIRDWCYGYDVLGAIRTAWDE